MLLEDNDYEHFFYNSGLHIGEFFGDKSIAFKLKVVGQYKSFIDSHGGIDKFSSSQDAVRHYIRKTKGGSRGISKY